MVRGAPSGDDGATVTSSTSRPPAGANANRRARVAKQFSRDSGLGFFHVTVAHQNFVSVSAEFADGLQHHASPPQLLGQLSVKLSTPQRQDQVQASLRPAHLQLRTGLTDRTEQVVSLSCMMSPDAS